MNEVLPQHMTGHSVDNWEEKHDLSSVSQCVAAPYKKTRIFSRSWAAPRLVSHFWTRQSSTSPFPPQKRKQGMLQSMMPTTGEQELHGV